MPTQGRDFLFTSLIYVLMVKRKHLIGNIFMDKNFIMLAALSCAATTSWAADNEPVDSIRTYELQGVQVTSTRAGKKTLFRISSH